MATDASFSGRRADNHISTLVRHAVRPNALPIVTALAGVAIIGVLGLTLGFGVDMNMYSAPTLILGPSTVILVLLGAFLWVLYRDRPARPTAHLWGLVRSDWRVGERLALGLPVFVAFPLFFSAFTSYKAAMGRIFPFYFDPYAVSIDRMLHGMDPWVLLEPIAGSPAALFALNFVYNLWFFIMFVVLAAAMFLATDLQLRARFLTAFVLCWMVVGVAGATALSSAGPCFYDYFFHDNHYAGLFAHLDTVRETYLMPAREMQTYVLDSYKTNEAAIGSGISAAPSMHVSIAVLIALFASHFGRWATVAGWAYALTIFIGSVMLGWHYAIDGYLSLALTVLVWMMAGKLTAWFGPGPASTVHARNRGAAAFTDNSH